MKWPLWQWHFFLGDHAQVFRPVPLLLLFSDFLQSKYCNHIRLCKQCGPTQHGPWTGWYNPVASEWHQEGFFLAQKQAWSVLYETAFVRSSSATVRSQISGIWGRHCHNLLLSCVSVSNQFSFKISLRQSLIPLSALTCGLSAILPSLTYLDNQILLALDHLIPRVSVQLFSSLKWHLQRPYSFVVFKWSLVLHTLSSLRWVDVLIPFFMMSYSHIGNFMAVLRHHYN